jgi:hypothetical protein
MSWVIAGRQVDAADADARAYLAAVEAADTQALEPAVRLAVDAFVVGCKADGIWTAIKASCILAGARTLAGALVPLVGAAPTNVDGLFVSGDYNRKTGLVGNGSTKYLDSNRNNNADPQDSSHNAIFFTQVPSTAHRTMGRGAANTGSNLISGASGTGVSIRNRNGPGATLTLNSANNSLTGHSRSGSANVTARAGGANQTIAQSSQVPFNGNIQVFGSDGVFSNARIAFYSIGESLDLALLDARVTTLINAFDSAI